MNRNTQVSNPLRTRSCGAALAALAVACLLGGCAVPSSGASPPHPASAGSPSAAGCAGGAGSGGTGSAGAGSGGMGSAGMGSGGTGSAAAPLQAIQFTGGGHGWAAGAGRILATSDGGRTWTRQYAGPAVLSQLDFTSTSDGWAVGPGALLRTVNGGASWTALREPRRSGHCLSVTSVHFVAPALGYAIAGGRLLRTTDGGVTWGPVTGAPAGAQAVCFSTAQDGYLGVPGRIWRTTDAGANWSPAFTEPPASPGPGRKPGGRHAGARLRRPRRRLGALPRQRHRDDARTVPRLRHAGRRRLARGARGADAGVRHPAQAALAAGPGSEPGPFSVIGPGAAAFVGFTPPANGWGTAPLTVATDGGAVLSDAGNIPAINEPLAAAFLTPAQGWVVGENLKSHTFSIEATTDACRTWTTQYTTS